MFGAEKEVIQYFDQLDLQRLDRNALGRRFIRPEWDRHRSRRKRLLPMESRPQAYTSIGTLSYVAGTALVWNSAGGTGGTITCTSLAVYTGGTTVGCRQGTKYTTGLTAAPPNGTNAVLPSYLQVYLQMQYTSTPTAYGEAQVFISYSSSATAGTANAGACSGTDAAGPNADVLGQLAFGGGLPASAIATTGVQQGYLGRVPVLDIYFSPVIVNMNTVTFDATAAHTILTITPYWQQAAA